MKSNLNSSGIYAIQNTVNGKVYIGSSVNLRKRKAQHWLALGKGTHKNKILQNAWNKHGSDGFRFVILEHCPIEQLLYREQFYLDQCSQYNICPTAGNTLGMKHTPEARAKIVEAKKHLSPETYARMSAAHKGKQVGDKNPNFGRKHTPEALAKIGAASLGRVTFSGKKHTEETKKKISARKIGVKLSDETRAKMSASHMGVKHSPEAPAKTAAALKGRKFSDEHRARIAAAAKGRKWSDGQREKRRLYSHSPETLAKMSISMKGKIPHNKGVSGAYRHSTETRAIMSIKIKAALAARRAAYAGHGGINRDAAA